MTRLVNLAALALLAVASACASPRDRESGDDRHAPNAPSPELRVLAWNVWHGGREDGDEVGPARVIEVIANSGADLVAMQETYGSGERIAEALGFHFHPRGANVSIHSRWPIVEDLSVHDPFQCVGALIELPRGERVAFFSIWLPYSGEIWAPGTRDTDDRDAMLAACEASRIELETLLAAIEARLDAPRYAGVPIVVAGDFNAMSPRDYDEAALDQYGTVVDWPTGRLLTRAGFRDAYRDTNPTIDRAADATWTPRFTDQEQDRIDFVHLRSAPDDEGRAWRPRDARVIRTLGAHGSQRAHGSKSADEAQREGESDLATDAFPSDHAAVLATLERRVVPRAQDLDLTAVTYNLRHGRGTDGRVDLARIAGVLRELDPDLVGLQEVDLGAGRSGGVNQVLELSAALGLHPAFGGFMDHDGGRYGIAVLSRYPIVQVERFELPTGNEPRIALLVDVRLPDDTLVTLVNVHFDWVDDDGFRFAQASALAERLRALRTPFVLLGDFNDGPDSRTLALFRGLADEADKPDDARHTWPADAPEVEIDFVFAGPRGAFETATARVVDEALASDHRPVTATLRLR